MGNQESKTRRKLLNINVAGTGTALTAKTIPNQWTRPIVDSVLLPAHAMKIERDVIARGVFKSVPDLKRKLMRYIKHYNKAPKSIKWPLLNSEWVDSLSIAPPVPVTGRAPARQSEPLTGKSRGYDGRLVGKRHSRLSDHAEPNSSTHSNFNRAIKCKYFDPTRRITSQSAVTGH